MGPAGNAQGVVVIYLCLVAFLVVLAIAILRWMLRVNEMVDHQKRAADAVEKLLTIQESREKAAKAAGQA